MIDRPGIYFDHPVEAYFRDPCPAPSLNQSTAKVLIEESPLHAWTQHPRLNPDYADADEREKRFDIGTIAHKLLLGRGREIVVVQFADWRTKLAQIARAGAHQSGKLAVLARHYMLGERMVAAAIEQLKLRRLWDVFEKGNSEVVLAWQEGDLWFRQMVDLLSYDRLTMIDYKTTDMAIGAAAIPRMMLNAGWPIQAAMAERGLDVLDPGNRVGRRRYLFVVQEISPPYQLQVVEIGEGALTIGRKMLAHAVDMWSDCVRASRWPGYPLEILRPEFPGWAETQWLDREVAESERSAENIWAG